jgi:hypothetical protein
MSCFLQDAILLRIKNSICDMASFAHDKRIQFFIQEICPSTAQKERKGTVIVSILQQWLEQCECWYF